MGNAVDSFMPILRGTADATRRPLRTLVTLAAIEAGPKVLRPDATGSLRARRGPSTAPHMDI